MFLPYTVDVPMKRLPVANWVLIAVTCAMTFQGWYQDSRLVREIGFRFTDDMEELAKKADQLRSCGNTSPPPAWSLVRGQATIGQLFTYVFAHADVVHLVGNMVFLFCFGNAVNSKLGHSLFLALYFLLGMFAGFCWLRFGHGATLVGASGAVMGICGVFLVFFPTNEVRIFFYGFHGFTWSEMASMWLVLLAMVLDLLGTLVFGPEDGVAYVAHLGGEVLGVMFACGLLLTGLAKSEEYELNLLQLIGLQPPIDRGDWRKKDKRRRRPTPADED